MLGSLEGASGNWQWGLSGKHPVARDYISIGTLGPITNAFEEWVEKGYQLLLSSHQGTSALYSWRFWVKVGVKHSMACGLLKGSSDSVGRPYPLLMMGYGMLPDWEENWHLLGQVCERTWGQMESVSARRFTELSDLENEIARIKSPSPQWSVDEPSVDQMACWNEEGLREQFQTGEVNKSFIVPLKGNGGTDLNGSFFSLLTFLKKTYSIPNVMFVGGTPQHTYVAVYKRALTAKDFVRLWTLETDP